MWNGDWRTTDTHEMPGDDLLKHYFEKMKGGYIEGVGELSTPCSRVFTGIAVNLPYIEDVACEKISLTLCEKIKDEDGNYFIPGGKPPATTPFVTTVAPDDDGSDDDDDRHVYNDSFRTLKSSGV